MHVRLMALLAACFLPVITGCPVADDDDSALDDDDSADDDDATADDDDSAAAGGCDEATGIDCGDALVGETNADGTNDIDQFACAGFATTGPEVWYEFTAADDDRVTVTMTPTAEDLDLFLIGADADGDCDPDNECLAASQDIAAETLTFDVTAGETYWLVVDGFDGATDTYDLEFTCDVPVYTWVAVRSRTLEPGDIDNNTPGPDIDAVLLANGDGDFWADEVFFVQGAAGAAGNVNDDAEDVLGESDMWDPEPTCVLDDVASGNSRFWSMGGGDATLGEEGWLVVGFGPGVEITDGSAITVYELSADSCDNVATARDDEYEVYVGLSSVDPDLTLLADFDGDDWMSLGETITMGGINTFDYVE